MADSNTDTAPLHTNIISNGTTQALPMVAAVFLVTFDVRKGYTIAWHKSVPEVDIEGVVEYKSLPSGLHNVKEDLVYFVHNDYAGISAFLNEPAPESERNASMLSVGVLVPLDYGRLGKSWLHAQALKDIARQQIRDLGNTERLEQYWETLRIQDGETSRSPPAESPLSYKPSVGANHRNGHQLGRVVTDATALTGAPHALSAYHPALSLIDFIKTFGPLVFRLYRAALLRKRILLVGEAPVHTSCDFVYNLSIISSIPKTLSALLPIDETPPFRTRPLFSVGVQDIPQLFDKKTDDSSDSAVQSGTSWIACTTDDVLATKPELFDMLVVLPPAHAQQAPKKVYPKLVESSPSLSRNFPRIGLKATQRDARRYQTLRAGLRSMRSSRSAPEAEAVSEDEDATSIISQASSTLSRTSVVEPVSWSLVAYTSLVWWASAGEKRSGPTEEEEAEQEQDRSLLMTDSNVMEAVSPGLHDEEVPQEIGLVSYFQRLTSLMFTTISDAISRKDGEEVRRNDDSQSGRPKGYRDDGEDDEAAGVEGDADQSAVSDDENQPLVVAVDDREKGPEDVVDILQEDMTAMGLDIWSAADRVFVEELIKVWWGRTAAVRGGRVECCGVRLL